MASFTQITHWKLLVCCAILYFTCMLVLLHLQQLMTAAAVDYGYEGREEDLKVFDLRMGFSVKEAQQLIRNWGKLGCRLYVLCEVLDYLVLMPGYGGVLLVLTNRLGALAARKTGYRILRKSAVWVLAVLAVDAVENAMQLALVLTFLRDPGLLSEQWWLATAAAGSAVNQAKWWVLRAGGALSLLQLAAILSPGGIKPKKKLSKEQ